MLSQISLVELIHKSHMNLYCFIDTCQTDFQCPDNFPICDTLDGKCKGITTREQNIYIYIYKILQLFYVIHEWSFHLLECMNDSHCHGAFPVCDTRAHKCVGKNIMLSNRMTSNV